MYGFTTLSYISGVSCTTTISCFAYFTQCSLANTWSKERSHINYLADVCFSRRRDDIDLDIGRSSFPLCGITFLAFGILRKPTNHPSILRVLFRLFADVEKK